MKNITVIIGNSDDKLTQARWSVFCAAVAARIGELAHHVHFAGGSHAGAPWQNSAWVFEIGSWQHIQLKEELAGEARAFNQDSIAWIEGETQFI